MGKIIIDDGTEEFTIEDKQGNILGSFRMNPSDVNIAKRFEEVADKITHLADNVDENQDLVDVIDDLEKKVYEQINYLFNADIADEFFSITSPFTPLANGQLFLEQVLEQIGKLVESDTGKRFKKIQTKASKYTKKYHA